MLSTNSQHGKENNKKILKKYPEEILQVVLQIEGK